MQPLEKAVLANLQMFVGFARKRLGDASLAEDVVQESLLKALRADRRPETEADSVTWFYRILRRAIIDIYRRRDVRRRAADDLAAEMAETPSPEENRALCTCFHALMPALPPAYADALERVDLGDQSPGDAAAELGITLNNFNVRLHRARRRLRSELEHVCKACSKHGCLDCTCPKHA